MPQVLIGMGSNIHPESHLKEAALVIRQAFPDVRFSSVYQSEAVGMKSDDFLNACCVFQYATSDQPLQTWLKALEDQHARDRSEGSWKPRTLDLDILAWDGKVVDDDLYQYGHIFVPASELVPLQAKEEYTFAALEMVNIRL